MLVEPPVLCAAGVPKADAVQSRQHVARHGRAGIMSLAQRVEIDPAGLYGPILRLATIDLIAGTAALDRSGLLVMECSIFFAEQICKICMFVMCHFNLIYGSNCLYHVCRPWTKLPGHRTFENQSLSAHWAMALDQPVAKTFLGEVIFKATHKTHENDIFSCCHRLVDQRFLALPVFPGHAEESAHSPVISYTPETQAQKDARLKWWSDARFGMFIHWGLYSIPAGVWQDRTDFGEWFLEQTHTPVSQYEKYASQFDPTNFDATAWVRAAKAAGVKYIVITSKHHDGFGMFRSDLTDWCIKSTPFKRDPLQELSAACKAEGIRFCCYYSIMDWHSADWGNRRTWNDVASTNNPPDMDRYVHYMDGQLKELLTRYGPIGLLWFDGQWESCWTRERGDDLVSLRSESPAGYHRQQPREQTGFNRWRWFCHFRCHGRLRHAGTDHSPFRFRPRPLLGIVHDHERPLGLQ